MSDPSGSYKFALPKKNHDHLAFISVSLGRTELDFEREASSDAKGEDSMVLYTADLGEADEGAKIVVSHCFPYEKYHFDKG